ncbi:hypothetical protein J4E81_003229 [Alternaria sp. BMP 2799]|nr:hypothetical protein J4E81_003229 [Alternaria sp. BMP 2799]
MGLYLGDSLPQAVARRRDILDYRMAPIRRNDVVFQACIDALLFALNRANTRNPERFKELIDGVFGHGLCPVGSWRDQDNIFLKGSLGELLSWRPDPWWIPEDADLSRMEILLCNQTDPKPARAVDPEVYHSSVSKFRCYFAAAAVAIDYQQLLHLREIVLIEDRMSMLRPACHMRGLIAFCKSNPALRIEHKIGLLKNLLPEITPWGIDDGDPYIMGYTCLNAFVPWIDETTSLFTNGMPVNAYQLIIDGSTREAIHAFEIMKYAAAMQEAMLTQAKRNGVEPTPWIRDPNARHTVSLAWQLPAGFSQAVRGIVDGTSNIRFTGPVGEVWDADVMFFERKDWTEAEWRKEWSEKVELNCPETDFFKDVKAQYEL